MPRLVSRNEDDRPIDQPGPMPHGRDHNRRRLRQNEGASERDAGANRAKVMIPGRSGRTRATRERGVELRRAPHALRQNRNQVLAVNVGERNHKLDEQRRQRKPSPGCLVRSYESHRISSPHKLLHYNVRPASSTERRLTPIAFGRRPQKSERTRGLFCALASAQPCFCGGGRARLD
jgi:hypothetical protein